MFAPTASSTTCGTGSANRSPRPLSRSTAKPTRGLTVSSSASNVSKASPSQTRTKSPASGSVLPTALPASAPPNARSVSPATRSSEGPATKPSALFLAALSATLLLAAAFSAPTLTQSTALLRGRVSLPVRFLTVRSAGQALRYASAARTVSLCTRGAISAYFLRLKTVCRCRTGGDSSSGVHGALRG